jgi:multidrug efflux system membrane fusion protein
MNSASTIRSNLRAMLAAGALSGAVILAGCHREPSAAAAGAQQARQATPVTAVAAISRHVPVYLDEIGKIVAIEMVSLTPQVGGKILTAHVEDGAYVKKGQLLFEIDPAPYEAALASAKAQLAQSKAELVWAQADFDRTKGLMGDNVISQLEFDQKKSNLGVAEAKVSGAEAAVQAADLNLTYTKIYSPIDGRAGVRLVDPGNVVKANEGALLTIQQLDPIYAEFTVTENDLGTVRKYLSSHGMTTGDESNMGLKVMVDVPGDSARILSALGPDSASPTSQPTTRSSQPREGTLTFLDNSVQTNTGTVKLRATLPNADRYFWPGQFVNVRLILTMRDAVLVPAQAVQIGQEGTFVYVAKQVEAADPATQQKTSSTIAEQRSVVAGQRHDNLVVVDKGIEVGEKVVVTGQMQITPQGPIMITNEASPQPQPQTAMAR